MKRLAQHAWRPLEPLPAIPPPHQCDHPLGLVLAAPILLFLASATVLPNFGEADDRDMRRDYEAQRRIIALTFALF